jgi:hypothetical protein
VSRYERYGTRSLVYSKWHRFYLGDGEPMIDLDGIEYCTERGCSKPLVLIETAVDIGQRMKPTTVLRNLAQQSGVLALCVLYTVTEGTDPAVGCGCQPTKVLDNCDHGITRFRVRRIHPPNPSQVWQRMTPEEFRDRLRRVRMDHVTNEHRTWEATA